MTKKDFELIAECLKTAKPDPRTMNVGGMQAWSKVVRAFEGRLFLANPKFDQEKFREACGAPW